MSQDINAYILIILIYTITQNRGSINNYVKALPIDHLGKQCSI